MATTVAKIEATTNGTASGNPQAIDPSFLTSLSSAANENNIASAALTNATAPPSEEALRGDYEAIINRTVNGKRYSTMNRENFGNWLRWASPRSSDRIGNLNLNYMDFYLFSAKYGDALGKERDIKLGSDAVYAAYGLENKPAQGFAYPDDKGDALIVWKKDYSGGHHPNHWRTEAPIADYAEDMIDLMDVHKRGSVTFEEFKNWMQSKYSVNLPQ
jgi:hypothetical protein